MTATMGFGRRTWMTLEPMHGMVYFSPFGASAYDAIGLTGRQHYFASRSAALGSASAELVASTFFNFAPALVGQAVPSCWSVASPAAVLAARYDVVDRSLRDAGGDLVDSADIQSAASLAREAALVACGRAEGRPLFGGHASLPWPEVPHLVLWHAQTLLREFRGDGHIALLVAEGMSGLEALITHCASGAAPIDLLKALRGWNDDEWAAGVESLRSRGLVRGDDVALTDAGAAWRDELEARTDVLADAPYAALGEERCAELRRLARPLSAAVIAAGWSPLRRLPEGEE